VQNVTAARAPSESQFAALVDALAADPDRRSDLADLLREDQPLYRERGAATIVRMRGWVLLAMARVGLTDAGLIFVLEELDTGIEPYLVATAARALRSYPHPGESLAPFVMRALTNIRYRDQPVSFESYGDYAVSSTGTSPAGELLATLTWLGPHARGVLPALEALRAQPGGLSRKLRLDIDRALHALRRAHPAGELAPSTCCVPPSDVGQENSRPSKARRDGGPIESIVFEDHDGAQVTFKKFFQGGPSIVVFFYTRCDNPFKCSLTVTKLARIQKLLEAAGVAEQICTAAITYDPAFDLPQRLRLYGQNRGVRLDARHRMLRTPDGIDRLCDYFELGVNFVESLVNRHRIEVYILDRHGRVAASFERLHWDERQAVTRAIDLLNEGEGVPRTQPEPGAADRCCHGQDRPTSAAETRARR
jgi:cytochrome oxidase Cu insertion factor (SCO1/SenC/PrrC family)